MTDAEEIAYEQGRLQGWRMLLRECMQGLGFESPEATGLRHTLERTDAVLSLRSLCRDFGDNDWPDDLCIQDVIDKHLANHLYRNSADWRPITEATIDGTPVLLLDSKYGVVTGMWITQFSSWHSIPGRYTLNPQKWMPLPEVPEQSQEQK